MSLVRASEVIAPARTSVPRDGYGRPLVVPKGGGKPIALTRTTTFIDCIEDKSALANWRARMTLVGAARLPRVIEEVKLYDPKLDKQKLDKLAEQAFEASGANDKREKGTYLHSMSEQVEAGEVITASEEDLSDLGAYLLERDGFKPVATEEFVVCDELGVGGTPDRIDLVEKHLIAPDGTDVCGQNLITDLKTGTVEYGKLKMAAQLAIYSRAEKYDHSRFPVEPVKNDPDGSKALAKWKKIEWSPEEAAAAYSPPFTVNQEWGIIFNLPSGSGECEPYWADLTFGWEMAKLAKTIRAARSQGRRALTCF